MSESEIHSLLSMEGRFDVISQMRNVELKTPGFSTIVVPISGFSNNDYLHNAVLNWFKDQGTNLINTRVSIARMKQALGRAW